ncbi:MAG: hypothetical protein LBC39_06280 [Methanobrevibacter sp.]|jgi:hypothetical protein|nr:hypothetical protein [Candidatus Methanovirga aequatorialis]
MENEEISNKSSSQKAIKLETCYLCNQKFDVNKDDNNHYHYGKYPMCANCSEAYGFFSNKTSITSC